ncbi:MAG: ATP-binding cassette domain-containing protein, partial [Beijerinckiaceae bacterium]
MITLEARGLTVAAHIARQPVEVLRNIDIALAPGRVLGLVGESGAGKSMIGRAIAQNLPPGFAIDQGSLQFQGREMTTLSAGERLHLLGKDIAFIPQEPLTALNPTLTVAQQFDEHLARLGIRRSDRRGRIV